MLFTLLLLLILLEQDTSSSAAASAGDSSISAFDRWGSSNGIPPLSIEHFRRIHRLQRWLRVPTPKPFLEWAGKWTTMPLDYGGKHPFDARQRTLRQEQSTPASKNDKDNNNVFEPIRITFVTDPLESRKGQDPVMDARINLIVSKILPQVAATWSSHLSVVPNMGTIHVDSSTCYGLLADQTIPSDIFRNGIKDTDLAIFTTNINTVTLSDGSTYEWCSPTKSVLASATLCSTDQYDRPNIGFINFCVWNSTDTHSRRRRRRQLRGGGGESNDDQRDGGDHQRRLDYATVSDRDEVLIALHEIGHVLGMSSVLFPYFRNPITGEPLTPRPILPRTVNCAGGTTQYLEFPANNTLQAGMTDRGRMYYDVVTPHVQAVVRNHFNCPSLNGARLDDHDTRSDDCSGSHWDQRLFFGELMQAIFFSGASDVLSPLTLALMEDTGWYQVNYGNAKLAPFGHGVGCDFVNHDCIVNNSIPDYGKGFFCSTPLPFESDGTLARYDVDYYCDPTHSEFAICTLFDTQQTPSKIVEEFIANDTVPYFSNPNWLGMYDQVDFCPMPILPADVVCSDSSTAGTIVYEGEQYGSTSRCINAYYSKSGKQRNFPGCFRVQCDAEALQVIVNGVRCERDFQEIAIPTVINSQNATMICPRLSVVCPNLFCPGDCSGQGKCNYSQTKAAQCECFDASDTSPDCSGGAHILRLIMNRTKFFFPETLPAATPTTATNSTNSSISPTSNNHTTAAAPQPNGTAEPTSISTVLLDATTASPSLNVTSASPPSIRNHLGALVTAVGWFLFVKICI